jgi:hypothetical protein
MKTVAYVLALCTLPIALGVGARYGFARIQGSCTAMVGPLLVGECHTRQRRYQLKFELAAATVGVLIAAAAAGLEHRRRRVVEHPNSTGETS